MSNVQIGSILSKLSALQAAAKAIYDDVSKLAQIEPCIQAPALAPATKPSKNQPTAAQAKRIDSQRFSWGIKFHRAKRLKEIQGIGGWVRSPGLVRTSERRFGTRDEARHHANRFIKLYGHKGATIYKMNKRVNAWVNLRTGKTNPVIGLGRTNRH